MNRHVYLVLRHSLFSASTLSVQCYDTPAYVVQACSICTSTALFSTVLYLQIPIVMRPSHSLLLVYVGKHLYDKYPNNET